MAQASAMRPRVITGGATMLNGRGLGNILVDEFFQYTTVLTFATGLETLNVVIPIQSDAHFVVMTGAYTNTLEIGISGAGVGVNKLSILNGGATIQITDLGNQHFLSNAQVPVNTLFGSGELPHVWEMTHLFKANTGIGIQATGNGAGVAGEVIRLVFSGMKIPRNSRPELGL